VGKKVKDGLVEGSWRQSGRRMHGEDELREERQPFTTKKLGPECSKKTMYQGGGGGGGGGGNIQRECKCKRKRKKSCN